MNASDVFYLAMGIMLMSGVLMIGAVIADEMGKHTMWRAIRTFLDRAAAMGEDEEDAREVERLLTRVTHPTASPRLAPHAEGRTCPKCRRVSFDLRARRCVNCGMVTPT